MVVISWQVFTEDDSVVSVGVFMVFPESQYHEVREGWLLATPFCPLVHLPVCLLLMLARF
jgi:hypothetical protein